MSPKARSWQARQNKPEASSLGNYWQLLKRAHWERLTTKALRFPMPHANACVISESCQGFGPYPSLLSHGAHVLKHLEDVVRLN